jgi:hypothetical protein
LITEWIHKSINQQKVLHLAIDRTRWQVINILVISLIYKRRAIPLYFKLLDKKGNSNLGEQTESLDKVLSKLSQYKVVVLGDREFCSVDDCLLAQGKESIFLFAFKKESLY